MLEHGDSGAVSAKSGTLDRHPPAGNMDGQRYGFVVPLHRGIGSTLNVESSFQAASTWAKARLGSIRQEVTSSPDFFQPHRGVLANASTAWENQGCCCPPNSPGEG
jgi:hypothetical protein